MANDALLQWTTPMDGVRVFDPASLARGRDTLVLLSKNGTGSGSAFVTALVRAVCKIAQQQAEANGGRLPVPLVLELDECANVVRWPELPEVYSFYGSLGIVLSSYFQSPAQAVAAFGKEGWESIWGAAVTRCYGGGVADSP
ncbi:TPA: TraM recognition domain-containing protein, partial [Enterococcus faecium]|nr:TraM recognition domain-containing protein [Enterococcus faecium]